MAMQGFKHASSSARRHTINGVSRSLMLQKAVFHATSKEKEEKLLCSDEHLQVADLSIIKHALLCNECITGYILKIKAEH